MPRLLTMKSLALLVVLQVLLRPCTAAVKKTPPSMEPPAAQPIDARPIDAKPTDEPQPDPKRVDFIKELYKWLIMERYEIINAKNEFAPRNSILSRLVPLIGHKAAKKIADNCLTKQKTVDETLQLFAYCSLDNVDEV